MQEICQRSDSYSLWSVIEASRGSATKIQRNVKLTLTGVTSLFFLFKISQLEMLSRKSEQLKTTSEANAKRVNQLSVKTMLLQSTTHTGEYMWKLDNFNKRLMEALSTQQSTSEALELFTPPLYTSRFGYKLCAKIILNGGATQEHISFYIIIMRGDYDEALQWPFPHVINATLVNPRDSTKSVAYTLIPNPELPNFRKPTKTLNPAIGFARFCSHDSLIVDDFVISDAIFLKIQVEQQWTIKVCNHNRSKLETVLGDSYIYKKRIANSLSHPVTMYS